jgi:regulator of sirC expression with transglutaminase-like and TPR domain
LDIPVYGVNLPQQFVLAYKDDSSMARLFSVNPSDKILFYINPFNRGSIFSRKEIDSFLIQINTERREEYYAICDNKVIVIRMLNNLIHSYTLMGYEQKVKDLQRIKFEVFGV